MSQYILCTFLEGNNTSDHLNKAQVTTVPLSECNAVYLEHNKRAEIASYQNGIKESHYCARYPVRRRSSCIRNSGEYYSIEFNRRTIREDPDKKLNCI